MNISAVELPEASQGLDLSPVNKLLFPHRCYLSQKTERLGVGTWLCWGKDKSWGTWSSGKTVGFFLGHRWPSAVRWIRNASARTGSGFETTPHWFHRLSCGPFSVFLRSTERGRALWQLNAPTWPVPQQMLGSESGASRASWQALAFPCGLFRAFGYFPNSS